MKRMGRGPDVGTVDEASVNLSADVIKLCGVCPFNFAIVKALY